MFQNAPGSKCAINNDAPYGKYLGVECKQKAITVSKLNFILSSFEF